jgi:hypothetical protein
VETPFIEKYSNRSIEELNQIINDYQFEEGELIDGEVERAGKSKKYKFSSSKLAPF